MESPSARCPVVVRGVRPARTPRPGPGAIRTTLRPLGRSAWTATALTARQRCTRGPAPRHTPPARVLIGASGGSSAGSAYRAHELLGRQPERDGLDGLVAFRTRPDRSQLPARATAWDTETCTTPPDRALRGARGGRFGGAGCARAASVPGVPAAGGCAAGGLRLGEDRAAEGAAAASAVRADRRAALG